MYLLRPEKEEIEIFDQGRAARLAKYPELVGRIQAAQAEHAQALATLDQDGFVVLRNVFSKHILMGIRFAMDQLVEKGLHLKRAKNVRAADANSHWTKAQHLTGDVLTQGASILREHTNTVDIDYPFVRFPKLLDFAREPKLVSLAGLALECFPALGFVKMRRSFVNGLPEFDTNLFHVDGNSRQIIKVFIYLHDVDRETGAFCYVKGSHKLRFDAWKSKDRFTREEMVREYGEDAIVPLEARAGDVIVSDNSGFHCGLKPSAKDRSVVILNYVIHEEYGGGGDKTRMPKDYFEGLDDSSRALFDLLEAVDT